MNTGVILRERKNGKKVWSAIKLKSTLAEQLAYLGKEDNADNEMIIPEDGTHGLDDGNRELKNPVRLQRSVCHTPIELQKRGNCRAHKQRKTTRYYCKGCKKYLCLDQCWENYHSKRHYIVDDINCTGTVLHQTSID